MLPHKSNHLISINNEHNLNKITSKALYWAKKQNTAAKGYKSHKTVLKIMKEDKVSNKNTKIAHILLQSPLPPTKNEHTIPIEETKSKYSFVCSSSVTAHITNR